MPKVLYNNDVDLALLGCSPKLCGALYQVGCTTVGNVMDAPIIDLISNRAVLNTWNEFSELVMNIYIAKGSRELRKRR